MRSGKKQGILEFTLTNNERKLICEALSNINYDPDGSQNYITSARVAGYAGFPKRILEVLEEQKSSKKPFPYFMINNVPIDEFIYGSPSFNETGTLFKSGCLSENIICSLGSIIGEPYSIFFEGKELVNNLTPQKDTKYDYTGLGSEVELDFHIENAALKFISDDDYSPMALILLGIRSDPDCNEPKTYVADARLALERLEKTDLDILKEKRFLLELPYRWRNFVNLNTNGILCPILSGSMRFPRISAAFYHGMVKPIDGEAKNAFMNLYKAVKNVSIGIDITQGKLIFIDNRFSFHSRDKFIATYDENGLPYRWLQRIFIAQNLWSVRSFPAKGERIFKPEAELIN